MKNNYVEYDYLKSFERIDKIIDDNGYVYEEVDEIPSRDKLTFNNGFYVNCSAIFVDIRGSSELPNRYTRPKLAKLYRSYVSEIVAIMNGNSLCAEINIVGDCVSGIFNSKYKSHINCVFETAARIISLIKTMNYKFEKKGIESINVGIGISYGRALMIKAGYNGSKINDVVWMGDVINEAAKLCSFGNREWYDKQLMVSSTFYNYLNENYRSFLYIHRHRGCYHGDVVNSQMKNWYKENCP